MGKTHPSSSILSRWVAAVVILASGVAIVSGALYIGKLPGSQLDQSKANGWTTPIASSKEISTPDGCKKIVSTLGTEMFIPTRTQAEWDSFEAHTPAGVRIEECVVGSCGWQLVASPWGECSPVSVPLLKNLGEPPSYSCDSSIDGKIQSYRSAEACWQRYGEDPSFQSEESWKCVCPATPPPPVNGKCGSSDKGTFPTAPTTNLCTTGNPSTVAGSGPWTWSCSGQNGGSPANCSATKTQGAGWCNGGTIVNTKCQSGTPANNCNGAGPEPYCSCPSGGGGWLADGDVVCSPICNSACGVLSPGQACGKVTGGTGFGTCKVGDHSSDQGIIYEEYCEPNTKTIVQCTRACTTQSAIDYWNRSSGMPMHCPLNVTIIR